MKVLFVQGDKHWRSKLQQIFNVIGYEKQVQYCWAPRQALGRIIRGIEYDLVMVDYGWSVNGLVKQIKQHDPSISVVCYSASVVQLPLDVERQIVYKDIDTIVQRVRKQQISHQKHKNRHRKERASLGIR